MSHPRRVETILSFVLFSALFISVQAQVEVDVFEQHDRIDELEPEVIGLLENANIDASGYFAHHEETHMMLMELERLWEQEMWDQADELEIEIFNRQRPMIDAMNTVREAARRLETGDMPRKLRDVIFEMGMAFGRGEFGHVLNIRDGLIEELEMERQGGEPRRDLQEPAGEIGAPQIGDNGIDWEAIGVVLLVAGAAGGWYLQRRKRGHVARYLNEIDDVYSSYRMKTRRVEAELYRLKDIILEDFKKGKLDDNSYALLDKRIDGYLKEAREQIMNERFGGLPNQLKGELSRMLADGTIKEEEFAKFEKVLSKTAGIGEEEKKDLTDLLVNWKEKDKDGP